MKAYLISTPEQLKAAAECVKWSNDKRKVLDFATVWSATIRKQPDKPFPFKVTLELGRQAILFREKNGAKTPLGTMLLTGAREFAKGLAEDG